MSFQTLQKEQQTATQSPSSENSHGSLSPPAFQLKASGDPNENNGGPQKGAIPTMDVPASPGALAKAQPTPVPEEVLALAEQNIQTATALKMIGEVVVVHSPCYSAEIFGMMSQLEQGELEFETVKKAVLDRLGHLLNNPFVNGMGEENTWAKENLEGTTLQSGENNGATWYDTGNDGYKYLVLTDWNNPQNPKEGGNQYAIYRMDTKTGEIETFYDGRQPFGDPLTSKDAFDSGGETTKAKETGPGIDITWLQRIINMMKPNLNQSVPKGKPYDWDQMKKINEIVGGGAGLVDNTQTEIEDAVDKKQERKAEVFEVKKKNTEFEIVYFDPKSNSGGFHRGGSDIGNLEDLIQQYPTFHFKVKHVSAKEGQKPTFTISEINEIIETYQHQVRN